MEPGALLIESSTLTPEWIGNWYAATKHGCEFDAPVTHQDSRLSGESVLVGGSPAGLEKALPFEGDEPAVHAGPSGQRRVAAINTFCGVGGAWAKRWL